MTQSEHTLPFRRGIHGPRALALALAACVLAVTAWAYWPGLAGPLLLDDGPQLDGLIEQAAGDPVTLFGNYIISSSGPLGRPVAMASFIADAITHGPDIWWWKYANLMFHLISGLLVLWLTALLLGAAPRRSSVDPWIGGLIVAGLWLTHPLQVSTVLYTVQRMTELSTLFVLAGLVCYVKGRLLLEHSAGRGWLLIGLGFGLFFPLALFSKENALLFPVYCSLIEVLVFSFSGPARVQRPLRILHAAVLAACALAAVVVLANFSSIVLDSYAARDFTLGERLLTQLRVLVIYLSQLLLPVQRRMGFFHDDITLSTGLFDPVTTALSAALLAALAGSAIVLRRRLPLYAFGILLFFASHTIESSLLGLELMFEHRNYMGSFGILIAALSIALLARDHHRGLAVIAAVSLAGFSLLTWQRALTWSEQDYMYDYMYRAHPESSRLNLIFANGYAAVGDYRNGRYFLDKVKPGLGTELHRLFFECLEHGRLTPEALARVSAIDDGIIDGHTTSSADALLGQVIAGRCQAPGQSLLAALDHGLAAQSRSDRDRVALLLSKARLLEAMQDVDAAMTQYLAAQALLDDDAQPTYLAADALARAGRLEAARAMLTRANELEQNTRIQRDAAALKIYAGLGAAFEQAGHPDEALALYAEAMRSLPRQALFYVRSATLLSDLQRYDEAAGLLDAIDGRKLVDLALHAHELQRVATQLARADR